MIDLSEKIDSSVRHQGDEIRTSLGIIVIRQADGATVVFLRVVFHLFELEDEDV